MASSAAPTRPSTTAAPKRYICELLQAVSDARFWIQGVIVGHGEHEYLVDDGTAVASIGLYHIGQETSRLPRGAYIMVVGAVTQTEESKAAAVSLIAHNLVNLSSSAGLRMPLWWMEVAHGRVPEAVP